MAATIPATNKWLLTKQASVAQSAEQWQAGDRAEQRQGGRQDSSASREAGGPHWHTSRRRGLEKEKGGCWSTKKKKKGDIWRQRRKGWWPRVRLGTQVSTNACSSEIPLNACTVMQKSDGCFHHRRVFAHIAGCHTVPPRWLYHQSICMGRFGVQTSHWGIFIDIPFNTADTGFSSVYIKKNSRKIMCAI